MSPQTYPELEIRSGQTVRRFPLHGRIVLGRGDEADLRLDDHKVSRLHCRLEPVNGGVKVTDLGSSNGTKVNGREISQIILRPGDVASMGGTELRLTSAAPSPAAASIAAVPPVPRAAKQRPSPRSAEASVVPRKRRRVKELPAAATTRVPLDAPAVEPEPGSPRRRSNNNYLPTILLVVGVGVLITIVVGLGGEDEAASAAVFEREARALEANGDISGALGKLNRLQRSYPETPAAQRAEGLIGVLEGRLKQRREGLSALSRALDDRTLGTFALLQRRLIAIGARYDPAVSRADVDAKIAEAQRLFDERSSAFVAGVRVEAIALMRSRAFGPALGTIARAEASGRAFGSAREKLQSLRDLIELDARRRFGDLLLEIKSKSANDVLARLRAAVAPFTGTAHEGEVRARRALLEADIARVSARPGVATGIVEGEPSVAPTPAPDLLKALSRAEGLVGRRRFAASIQAFEEVLKHVTDRSERQRLERRLERVRGMAAAVDAVIAKVKAQPGAFRGIKVGRTVQGNVTDATRDLVTVSVGPGATVLWDWARMTAERFERLVIRSGLDGLPSVEAATVLLDLGAPEAALRILARRFDKEPSLRRRMDEIVVEARGMKEIPVGGFHLHDARLLTTEERDEAVLIARLDDLERQVVDAIPGAWQNAATELRGLGPRGEQRLKKAFHSRLDGFAKRLESLPALRKKRVALLRQHLFGELQRHRAAALALIYDSKRYPYPNPSSVVKAQVKDLVARVREIWATPSSWLLAHDEDLQGLHQDAVAATSGLESLGETIPGPERLLALVDGRVDMRRYDGGKGIVEHWVAVQAHNDDLLKTAVLTEPERECYRATNDYRVMMGLRAVMGHEALVKAARGHSQEMKDKGYFDHKSPTPGRQSPGQRARLAGWGGSVSENIARGRAGGRAVVRQWCNSSGHHRNILGRRWTHLGAGRSAEGSHWTQNFGTGRSKPPERRGK
ncbi:MAG: FHA domain-containing protein [Planctomycetes bacterium]|nr:FHA domain-containing protein [Planctomycetota bacterium]